MMSAYEVTLDHAITTIDNHLTLNSPNNASLGTPSSVTVTITDDDPAPTVAWRDHNSPSARASAPRW